MTDANSDRPNRLSEKPGFVVVPTADGEVSDAVKIHPEWLRDTIADPGQILTIEVVEMATALLEREAAIEPIGHFARAESAEARVATLEGARNRAYSLAEDLISALDDRATEKEKGTCPTCCGVDAPCPKCAETPALCHATA